MGTAVKIIMSKTISVVHILWLRQMKRYFRSRARILSSLGQPLLFLVGLGFGMGPTFQKAGHGNYIQFIAPGIIAMSILFSSVFSGIEIIWDRQFGFLKETLVAPVNRIHIVLGRTIGSATVAMIQGLLVFGICMIAGFRPQDLSMLPIAFAFMFMIAILFTAVGTVVGSILEDMQSYPLIMNFLVMPLFFFSGALFPKDGLPRGLELVLKANPMAYGVDGLRGAFTLTTETGLASDFFFLTAFTAILLVLGTYFFSKIEV